MPAVGYAPAAAQPYSQYEAPGQREPKYPDTRSADSPYGDGQYPSQYQGPQYGNPQYENPQYQPPQHASGPIAAPAANPYGSFVGSAAPSYQDSAPYPAPADSYQNGGNGGYGSGQHAAAGYLPGVPSASRGQHAAPATWSASNGPASNGPESAVPSHAAAPVNFAPASPASANGVPADSAPVGGWYAESASGAAATPGLGLATDGYLPGANNGSNGNGIGSYGNGNYGYRNGSYASGDLDYQSSIYPGGVNPSPVYADEPSAEQSGYAPQQGQPAGPNRNGYALPEPDLAYGRDGYQGYPGHGGGVS